MGRLATLFHKVLGVYFVLFMLALYAPIVIMITLSFNGPRGGSTFPLREPGLYWYWTLFHPDEVTEFSDIGQFLGDYWGGFWISLRLGFLTALTVTLFGTLAGQALRARFRGDRLIFYLILAGIVTPGIMLGLGFALFANLVNLTPHWYTTTLAVHLVWALPFAFLILVAMFKRLNPRYEEAALTLGARPHTVFLYITLPLMRPPILTAFLLGFLLSWDEVIRSTLVSGQESTLPVLIWGTLTVRVTPRLYALGTLATAVSLLVMGVYFLLARRLSLAGAMKGRS